MRHSPLARKPTVVSGKKLATPSSLSARPSSRPG